MLQDGLYDLSYRSGEASDVARGYGVASLRGGQILGSDPWGGLFAGSYRYDAERGMSLVHVQLTAPPDGVLITGQEAGPSGSVFDLIAEFKAEGPRSTAVVDVDGSPVAVELSYIGPLPRP
jgi:hypothetical protein